MEQLEVTIIIPAYNAEKFIKKSIDSCLNQTFQNFEIIIVNDGSTDDSYNIVKKIINPKIRLFSNSNQGLSYLWSSQAAGSGISGDPAAAEFLGDCWGGARAYKAVKDQIARARRSQD